MKRFLFSILLPGLLLFSSFHTSAQISFQKSYPIDGIDIKTFDAISCSDNGYAMAGIAESGSSEMIVIKMNCAGDIEWTKTLGPAESDFNESCRLLETNDNKILLMHSSGITGGNIDINISKMSLAGNLQWRKSYGGAAKDIGRDMIFSSDGMLIVTGSTTSIGSDASSASYSDILLFKVDLDGNLEWSKSFGNPDETEEGRGIAQLANDGELAITGTVQVNNSAYTSLIKTDFSGNLIWAQAYGLGNHFNIGTDLLLAANGSLLITGATTNFRIDESSNTDPMILRVNPADGALIDSRIYVPNDDFSDRGSRIISDGGGSYLMSVETSSYDALTDGTSSDKHGLFRIDGAGDIFDAQLLNTGGCFAPGVAAISESEYLCFGYSDQYSEPCCSFEALLIRMEADLDSGCNQNDILSSTSVEVGNWDTENYISLEDTGIISFNVSGQASIDFGETNTICEQFPPISAEFAPTSTCFGESIDLASITTGNIVFWSWNMDNGESFNSEDIIDYTYTESGTYNVNLFVSDGCRVDAVNHDVEIYETPSVDPGQEQTINEGESTTLGGSPTGGLDWSYTWTPTSSLDDPTNPNPEASPNITTTYTVIIQDAAGCTAEATVTINVIEAPPPPPVEPVIEGEPFIPNIFSPNGDDLNDVLFVYGGPYTSFNFEIYNRWGNKVFSSESQDTGWDGIFKGEKAPSAVYYYSFQGITIRGEKIDLSGNISLIR